MELRLPMTRGRLSVKAIRKSGQKAYNLQYRRKSKYFVRSVSSEELAYFERSTEFYRQFIDLVQKYVDEETIRGIKKIEKEVENARREKQQAL